MKGRVKENFSHAGSKEYFFDRQPRLRVNQAPARLSPALQPAQSLG